MTTEHLQKTEVNKPTSKTEIVIAVAVLIAVVGVMFYVVNKVDMEIQNHPEITMIGSPGIQINWISFVIIGLIALIAAITISIVFTDTWGGQE